MTTSKPDPVTKALEAAQLAAERAREAVERVARLEQQIADARYVVTENLGQ
jgi:hypothetical protein